MGNLVFKCLRIFFLTVTSSNLIRPNKIVFLTDDDQMGMSSRGLSPMSWCSIFIPSWQYIDVHCWTVQTHSQGKTTSVSPI